MNIWKEFEALLPSDPLLIGDVDTIHIDDTATVILLGGGVVRVQIAGAEIMEGDRVFIRSGKIEGKAPVLEGVNIEI